MTALTRRGLLVGACAAGLVSTLQACSAPAAPSGGPAPAGWSFTDDRGTQVSLKAQPRRIVAYDLAASPLMNIGVRPVGIFGSFPLDKSPQLAGLDLNGIARVGEAYGKLNLETLAAAQPDLIVSIFDPRLAGPVIGFPDQATQAQVEQLAPVLAINSINDLPHVIERFEQLGQALGVDLSASDAASNQQQFQAASTRVQATTAAKPELTALAVAPYGGVGFAFARPDLNPTLRFYESLGLKMAKPTSPPADINTDYNGFFYEQASFELAGKYPADLLLYDVLPGALDLGTLATIPTWEQLPAVQAGQLLPWRVLDSFAYKLLDADLGALADAIERATVVTGHG